MPYVATISVAGNSPYVRRQFKTIKVAWLFLGIKRVDHEFAAECDKGDRCKKALDELRKQDKCGKVHLHTPGRQNEDIEDAGLFYAVDWTPGIEVINEGQ